MSRNHINILSSTAIIALPGGPGTISEVCLATQYGRPVIVYHGDAQRLSGVPKEVEQTGQIAVVGAFLRKSALSYSR
jgi:predicted Rossmann-fold nucleotide-binding protein